MKKLSLSLFLFLFTFLFSFHIVSAVSFQSGDKLTLGSDKKINETVFVSANDLTINSEINGDLFCAGRNVVVNAPIHGDVICFAQNLRISGVVDGSVRSAAQTLDIGGTINRSLTAAAQTLTLHNPTVNGDAALGGQLLDLTAVFNRDLAAAGNEIKFNGLLNGSAKLSGQKITFSDSAKVLGNLDYYYESGSVLNFKDSQVKGNINKYSISSSAPAPAPVSTPADWFTGRLLGALSFLLLGLAAIYFSSSRTLSVVSEIVTRPVISFFVGLAVLFLTPVFFVILLISVIGIPLAFVILLLFIIGLILALVYASISLGQFIVLRFNLPTSWQTLPAYLLLGTLILWILMGIPFIGFLALMISFCIGLGSFFLTFLNR
ncbi:MAG TPA: polymer-forming cytoskeletal protein [Patescibacteria group bacterium]